MQLRRLTTIAAPEPLIAALDAIWDAADDALAGRCDAVPLAKALAEIQDFAASALADLPILCAVTEDAA